MPGTSQSRTIGREIDATMEHAALACAAAGIRVTKKRRRVLQTLLTSPSPLSAYALTEAYRAMHDEDIHVMTAYRILDAFIDAGIVHKLHSTQRYLACEHIGISDPHASAQFLICDSCGAVKEARFCHGEIAELERKARSNGFSLNQEQLELHGVCSDCMATADKKHIL